MQYLSRIKRKGICNLACTWVCGLCSVGVSTAKTNTSREAGCTFSTWVKCMQVGNMQISGFNMCVQVCGYGCGSYERYVLPAYITEVWSLCALVARRIIFGLSAPVDGGNCEPLLHAHLFTSGKKRKLVMRERTCGCVYARRSCGAFPPFFLPPSARIVHSSCCRLRLRKNDHFPWYMCWDGLILAAPHTHIYIISQRVYMLRVW